MKTRTKEIEMATEYRAQLSSADESERYGRAAFACGT